MKQQNDKVVPENARSEAVQESKVNSANEASHSDNETKVRFLSFQSYYLIAIHLAVIYSIFGYLRYGFSMGVDLQEGTWFILQGFSLWVPASLLVLPLIFILILIVLISRKWVQIRSDQTELTVIEDYIIGKTESKVKYEDITSIQLTSGFLGVKFVWVLLFGAHSIFLLTDGILFAFHPHAFGLGPQQGWFYILGGLVSLAVLLLIVIPGENLLRVETKDDIYKLYFSIWQRKQADLYEDIKSVLGLDENNLEGKSVVVSEKSHLESENQLSEKSRTRISPTFIIGLLYIAIAIGSRAANFFAGTPLRLILYLLGFITVLQALKDDGVNHAKYLEKNDRVNTPTTMVFEEAPLRKRATLLNDQSTADLLSRIYPKTLNHFEALFLCLACLFLGWTVTAWFRYLRGLEGLVWSSVGMVLLTLILLLFLLFHVIVPKISVQQITGDEEGAILAETPYPAITQKFFPNLWQGLKLLWIEEKTVMQIRLGALGLCFLIGILFGIVF